MATKQHQPFCEPIWLNTFFHTLEQRKEESPIKKPGVTRHTRNSFVPNLVLSDQGRLSQRIKCLQWVIADRQGLGSWKRIVSDSRPANINSSLELRMQEPRKIGGRWGWKGYQGPNLKESWTPLKDFQQSNNVIRFVFVPAVHSSSRPHAPPLLGPSAWHRM